MRVMFISVEYYSISVFICLNIIETYLASEYLHNMPNAMHTIIAFKDNLANCATLLPFWENVKIVLLPLLVHKILFTNR